MIVVDPVLLRVSKTDGDDTLPMVQFLLELFNTFAQADGSPVPVSHTLSHFTRQGKVIL